MLLKHIISLAMDFFVNTFIVPPTEMVRKKFHLCEWSGIFTLECFRLSYEEKLNKDLNKF